MMPAFIKGGVMNKLYLIAGLAMCLPLSALAHEPAETDPCGGGSILAMEKQPTQEDPAMQAKMDRLVAKLRVGHAQCMDRLDRIRQKDEALGIATPTRPAPQLATLYPVASTQAVCSVLAPSGQPCIQKLSEQRGTNGTQDEIVYGNGCATSVVVAALFNDGSRASSTVKAKSAATLTCDNCDGVKSFEATCP
jgi:hypothetical protein